MGATETLAQFIVKTQLSAFPSSSSANAIKVIADTFAVILAGVDSEVSQPLLRYLDQTAETGASPILGTGRVTSEQTAALINGTFGHALDYDDVLSMMPAHPSVVIVAALMASLKNKTFSGQQFIEAYLVGVEVGGKIGLGMTNEHYQRGFHATGTLALFSALAALAKLHQLDAATIQQAFGIAASMASGLRRNFGTMTKPLHSGLAARNALNAIQLARSGFTAADDIMEAQAGFFSTYGTAESDINVTINALGKPFIIENPGIALKKFPCCFATHRGIDAALRLRHQLGFSANELDRLICKMPPGGMHVLIYPRPQTGLEGKFSMPYCLAAAVLDGRFSLESFSDKAVQRPEIFALYEKIDAHESPSSQGSDPDFAKKSSGSRGFVEVEIILKDGRRASLSVDVPPGSPSRQLSWEELEEKFTDCAKQSPRMTAAKMHTAFQLIRQLDTVKNIQQLIEPML